MDPKKFGPWFIPDWADAVEDEVDNPIYNRGRTMRMLVVVGYATKLSTTMVPTIVTPIFRLKHDEDQYLMPPFKIYEGRVHGGWIISHEECKKLSEREEITILEPILIQARDRHDLWIDDRHRPHYEPVAEVAHNLRMLAKESLIEAEKLLFKNELDEAERKASAARSADPQLVDSLAIKAAIRRHKGEIEAAEFVEDLAKADWLPTLEGSFKALVERYLGIIANKEKSCL